MRIIAYKRNKWGKCQNFTKCGCGKIVEIVISAIFTKQQLKIEGLRAKRAHIGFLANFHFVQDRANFWQTDLF